MNRTVKALGICLAPLFVCGITSVAPVPRPVQSEAVSAIQRSNASAISVAIVVDGKIVSAQTFGNADSDTAFSVGSVSKMFTAVCVMQLAEQAKISLDDSAAKYLPQYPSLGNVSLRQLLNHTSGVPDYADDAVNSGDTATKTTPAQILSSTLTHPPDFAPGTDWNYSNTGYVILGQIVERVSHLRLSEFERRNIIVPVGMRHTVVAPELGKDVAKPFGGSPGDWSWYYADGDIFSTARDLALFDIALMDGRLVSRKAFQEMQFTVPFSTLAPGMRDGMGVFITSIGKTNLVGHHGGEPGFRADNEMIPEQRFAVSIVGNGSYDTTPILNAALRAYLPQSVLASKPSDAHYLDGAPAMTNRLELLIKSIASGPVDYSQFEVLATIAIPSLQRQLKSYGNLKRLTFMSKAYTSSGKFYTYQASFSSGNVFLRVLVESNGKVGQIALLGA